MHDDDELWIVECQVCTYQASARSEYRASDKADAHYNATGHTSDVFSEDR